MERKCKPVPWLSGTLAALIALLIVAIVLPNTNKAVVDHIEPQPSLAGAVLAVAFGPVLCIFTLGRRRSIFHWAGWIILGLLLTGIFLS